MNQIVSLSRNLSLQIADAKRKDEAKVVAIAEIIIAHTDGKNYTMNDHGEALRTTNVSEVRLHLSRKGIRQVVKYLKDAEKDLEKWDEMDEDL